MPEMSCHIGPWERVLQPMMQCSETRGVLVGFNGQTITVKQGEKVRVLYLEKQGNDG